MKRKLNWLSRSDVAFYRGFVSDNTPAQIRARHALRLAAQIRAFMPGLPGEVQDQLHNAAYALEEWAEKQK